MALIKCFKMQLDIIHHQNYHHHILFLFIIYLPTSSHIYPLHHIFTLFITYLPSSSHIYPLHPIFTLLTHFQRDTFSFMKIRSFWWTNTTGNTIRTFNTIRSSFAGHWAVSTTFTPHLAIRTSFEMKQKIKHQQKSIG